MICGTCLLTVRRCPVSSAEREGYEPTPPYLSNSMRYQYVKALGGTT